MVSYPAGHNPMELAAKRLAQGNFSIPSLSELDFVCSEHGNYGAVQLAEWGVPWPPPKGWRKRLQSKVPNLTERTMARSEPESLKHFGDEFAEIAWRTTDFKWHYHHGLTSAEVWWLIKTNKIIACQRRNHGEVTLVAKRAKGATKTPKRGLERVAMRRGNVAQDR